MLWKNHLMQWYFCFPNTHCQLGKLRQLARYPLHLTLVAVYENHCYKWLPLAGCPLKRPCIVGPYLEVKIFCSVQEMNRNDSYVLINNNIVNCFEPRSISSSYSVIVRVRTVLKRTVFGDWCFNNVRESHESWHLDCEDDFHSVTSLTNVTVLFGISLTWTITIYELTTVYFVLLLILGTKMR